MPCTSASLAFSRTSIAATTGMLRRWDRNRNSESWPLRSATDPVAFAGAGANRGLSTVLQHLSRLWRRHRGLCQALRRRVRQRHLGEDVEQRRPSLHPCSARDPRYFYKGTGQRYLANPVCPLQRGDREERQWQVATQLRGCAGNLAAGALSNLYYPASSRGLLTSTLVNGLVEIAGHAGTSVLREFVLKGHYHPPGRKTVARRLLELDRACRGR